MNQPDFKKSDKRLGELLRMEGLVDQEQVEMALTRQKTENELLGEAMVALGYITERDVARVIAKQYSLPFINLESCLLSKDVFEAIPPVVLSKYQLVPIDRIGSAITFATCGPITEEMFSELRAATECDIYLFVSTVSEVRRAISTYYESLNRIPNPKKDHGKLQQTPENHTG